MVSVLERDRHGPAFQRRGIDAADHVQRGSCRVDVRDGLAVFDEVSLVASENKLYSRYATPPQTTITQDHIRLAEIAADIIEAFPDASRVPSRTVLPYSLIVRDSVRSEESVGKVPG